jgi:hypothetical protein
MAWGRVSEVEQSCFIFSVILDIKVLAPLSKPLHGGVPRPLGSLQISTRLSGNMHTTAANPWNKQTNHFFRFKVQFTLKLLVVWKILSKLNLYEIWLNQPWIACWHCTETAGFFFNPNSTTTMGGKRGKKREMRERWSCFPREQQLLYRNVTIKSCLGKVDTFIQGVQSKKANFEKINKNSNFSRPEKKTSICRG